MSLINELEKQGNWLFRYRSHLPLVILVVGLAVFILQIYYPTQLFTYLIREHWHTYTWICLAIGLVGLGVRVFTVGHTPANTSGRNTTEGQVAGEVNRTGIYSLVRHPLYLGNFLMWLAIAMMSGSPGFVVIFVLAYWLYYERIMLAEETFLIRTFGTIYSDWAAVTPAFIPRLRGYVRPVYPFSWKKVLKKEKNGLFALLLLLLLFDGIAAWLIPGMRVNIPLLVMTLLTAILYLVLKVLKKSTNLLNKEGR